MTVCDQCMYQLYWMCVVIAHYIHVHAACFPINALRIQQNARLNYTLHSGHDSRYEYRNSGLELFCMAEDEWIFPFLMFRADIPRLSCTLLDSIQCLFELWWNYIFFFQLYCVLFGYIPMSLLLLSWYCISKNVFSADVQVCRCVTIHAMICVLIRLRSLIVRPCAKVLDVNYCSIGSCEY